MRCNSIKIYFLFLLMVLLSASVGFAQNRRAPAEAEPAKPPPPPPAVEFAIIEEVIAIDPGRMHEVRVRPGDIVRQGDVLGSLDYRRQWFALEVAKVRANDDSRVRELEAEVAMNTSVLDEHTDRLRRRQVCEHTVAQSQARLNASYAKLDAAKVLHHLSQLALDEAQRAYDDRFFFAPINGVVVTVEKRKNENVAASHVVFTIGDNSSWVLRREVSPETAASLFVGRTLPLFHTGSDVARLGRITNILRQDNGQHLVEMTVPNSMPATQTAPPQFEEPRFLPQTSAPATAP